MSPSHPTPQRVQQTLEQIYVLTGSIDVKSLWAYRDYLSDKIARIEREVSESELMDAMKQADLFTLRAKLRALYLFMEFGDAMRGEREMRKKAELLRN
jgi:hypothetical protein